MEELNSRISPALNAGNAAASTYVPFSLAAPSVFFWFLESCDKVPLEDAAEAVAYAKHELLSRVGCDKLFVCGTSAGAYLSMMLCFDKKWLNKYNLSANCIDGFIHDAGQPTVHFNVLKECGIDPRRVIIDERAPLYHVGESTDYPTMQIIVSDNDIENRKEETELLVGALKRFGYDMKKLTYTKTCGTHVWYVTKVDDDNKNEFAKLIIPFVTSHLCSF